MFDALLGVVTYQKGTAIALQCGPVAYRIVVPATELQTFCLHTETTLFISYYFREPTVTLYGFAKRSERDLFEILIQMSGIGPKIALAIIGHLGIEGVQKALEEQNHHAFTTVPGIGKKGAQKICIELQNIHLPMQKASAPPLIQDATLALVQLGYTLQQAQGAVKKSLEEDSQLGLSALIKKALHKLA